MRRFFNDAWAFVTLFVLALIWPFTSGWKAITSHRDILYDQMSVLFLSFVGLFLYVLAAWRVYEWQYYGRSLWAWLVALATLYILISLFRGLLHIFGFEDVEQDTLAW